MKYIENPFEKKFRIQDVTEAQSSAELIKNLCPKASGDVTECIKCLDKHCIIGKKARILIEQETASQNTEQDNGLEDELYREALSGNVSGPVYYIVRQAENLSTRPRFFTRREAIKWLKEYEKSHPQAHTEISLEEALKNERRKDYEWYTRCDQGISFKNYQQLIARQYRMRPNEVPAYIKELKREFGDQAVTKQNETREEEPERLTQKAIMQSYEKLQVEVEDLDEQYDERLEEVDKQIELLNTAIETYTAMIAQIRAMEKRIEFSEEIQEEEEPIFTEEDDEQEYE